MTSLKRDNEKKESQPNPRVSGTKGQESLLLERRILDTTKYYSKLTVRMLYYLFISRFGYEPGRKFYHVLDYHLAKMRRLSADLNARFVDPTRNFVDTPNPYCRIEIWVEKDTIRTLIEALAAKYKLPILVLRGFGSLSCFRKALIRAEKRGVKRVLYVGDHDASGVLIDKVAERETHLKFQRICLTMLQIRRLNLPSIPINTKDSRAEAYVKTYGTRGWEVEAMRPRTFFRLIEQKLRENVPAKFLVEARFMDTASSIARPFAERFRQMLEDEIVGMLKKGRTSEEILREIGSKNGLPVKKARRR